MFFIYSSLPLLREKHQGVGTNCLRLCGSNVAKHYHFYRDCPKLTSDWREIHKCLQTVFQSAVPFDAVRIYFSTTASNIQSNSRQIFNENISCWRKESPDQEVVTTRCSNIRKLVKKLSMKSTKWGETNIF